MMEKLIVNRIYRELQGTILELDEQMIHDCIKKINFIAQEENLDEKSILEDLHTLISNECAYHKKNIGNPKDPRSLSQYKWELGTGALGHAFIYGAYRLTWKPTQDEINMMMERYGYPAPSHPYSIPEATEEDNVRLGDLRQKSTLYKFILAPLAIGFIVPWIHGCIDLYRYYCIDTKHQEKYEKLSMFKECLEKAMQ